MDLHDRDDSKLRRQEALARRIGQALDEMDTRNSGQCPDGEILAAYAEAGLSPAAVEKWESHFATCVRCRKILQVLAVSVDTPLAEKEVAHLGELVAAVSTSAEKGSPRDVVGRGRSVIPIWRRSWVAPAIGIAAVLIVWLVMRPPWRAPEQRPPQNLIAQAPKEELPPNPAPLETAPPSREREQAQEQNAEQASPAKKESVPSAQEQRSLAQAQPQNAPAVPSGGIRDSNIDNRISAEAQAKAQPPAPAPAPSSAGAPGPSTMADAAAPAAPAPRAAAPSSTAQSVIVTEAAPQVEKANGTVSSSPQAEIRANLPVNGRSFAPLAQLKTAPGNTMFVKAPGSSVQWRVGKGGSVERSSDNGMTWVSQMSPSQQDWLAGAALSEKVCWLAGNKGAIARTVDGERWDLIPPPAQAAATGGGMPDWTGITARDALNATVTAADGRKFNTPDRGLTWQPQ
ncbi:MAG TPA: hypothetical protein VNZ56_02165 [Verrucomicrobiae bacterium]|jgi:hypothetical protein|nr:hypothetical protein [Verrucomicrobiae bacterium]